MRRRSRAGGEPVKDATPQDGKAEAPRCAEGRVLVVPLPASQDAEVARLTRELQRGA